MVVVAPVLVVVEVEAAAEEVMAVRWEGVVVKEVEEEVEGIFPTVAGQSRRPLLVSTRTTSSRERVVGKVHERPCARQWRGLDSVRRETRPTRIGWLSIVHARVLSAAHQYKLRQYRLPQAVEYQDQF